MLRINQHFPVSNKATLDSICQLARESNIAGLNQVIEQGLCINMRVGIWSPVMTLAAEGNDSAVTILIENFNAHITFAILGFAYGGHENSIAFFQMKYGWCDSDIAKYKAYGYAFKGNTLKADAYIGTQNDMLIRGYGAAGRLDKVRELAGTPINFDLLNSGLIGLAQSGTNALNTHMIQNTLDVTRDNYLQHYAKFRKKITYGLALGGSSVIARGNVFSEIDLLQAFRGYCNGGHINRLNELLMTFPHFVDSLDLQTIKTELECVYKLDTESNVLRFTSFCENPAFRVKIISMHIEFYRSIHTAESNLTLLTNISKQAAANYQNMHRYGIFNARIISRLPNLSEGAIPLIFEGHSFIHHHHIPTDLYFIILTYITELPLNESLIIYYALHQQALDEEKRCLTKPLSRVFNSLYRFFDSSEQSTEEKIKLAEENHQARCLDYGPRRQ